jgi:protein ImuB
LEDAAEPTDLLLDITGLAPIFGSEQQLARLIAESFCQRGYYVRIAVADTVGAVWAMAHFAKMQNNAERGIRNAECGMGNVDRSAEEFQRGSVASSVASVVLSKSCKEWVAGVERSEPPECTLSGGSPLVPRGSTPAAPSPALFLQHNTSSAFRVPHSAFLPPGHGLAPLHDLPVSALRLPEETVELLAELGIERIGELVALPRKSLASRFGDGIAMRIDQAAGTREEVIVAERPAVDFRAQWTLEYPTHNREAIDVIVTRLIEKVARRLAECDEGAIQLECCLTCGKHPARMSMGLFEPTATAPHLMQLIRMQFERLTLSQPVRSICVQATTTARLGQRQRELFTGDLRARPRQLAALIDRLSSRLGRDGVVRPQSLYDAQPERSWRYVPLAGQRRSRSNPGNSAPRRRKAKTNKPISSLAPSASRRRQEKKLTAASRPLRVHSPPTPLETIAVVPDGPPIRFTWQHQLHRIVRHWGPERIETGWWRGRSVRRDYYRVETDSGHRFWLFRQLDDGTWFLHGEFE